MSTAAPEDSWGYAESKGKSAFSENWGSMGIEPNSLGWNEEEGEFVD